MTNQRQANIPGALDASLPAAFAAYIAASSWALPIFFLYLILLLPNQFDTCIKCRNIEYNSKQGILPLI